MFFEKAGFVECLLTVCFSEDISLGQELCNSEHNSEAIYRCGWLSQSQKAFRDRMGLITIAISENLFFRLG